MTNKSNKILFVDFNGVIVTGQSNVLEVLSLVY
jgi:hypothetical protein